MKKVLLLLVMVGGAALTGHAKTSLVAAKENNRASAIKSSFVAKEAAKIQYDLHMAIFDTCGVSHVVLWETTAELAKFINDALVADCD